MDWRVPLASILLDLAEKGGDYILEWNNQVWVAWRRQQPLATKKAYQPKIDNAFCEGSVPTSRRAA